MIPTRPLTKRNESAVSGVNIVRRARNVLSHDAPCPSPPSTNARNVSPSAASGFTRKERPRTSFSLSAGSAAHASLKLKTTSPATNSSLIPASAAAAAALLFFSGGPIGAEDFIRRDANGDDAVDLSDAVVTLEYLYLGGGQLACSDAADANDDGTLDITDPIVLLQSLYLEGGPLPESSGPPGTDPTPDALICQSGD